MYSKRADNGFHYLYTAVKIQIYKMNNHF